MKIYRVSYRDVYSEHKGYEYVSSKSVAEKMQKKDNDSRDPESQMIDEVQELKFNLSKKGILNLLNIHCNYPDNG